MVSVLFNDGDFDLREDSRSLIFNFTVGNNVYGFSIAKKGITPKIFSSAVKMLEEIIEAKEGVRE